MYGKKLIRKIGSLVVVAAIIASAFVVLPRGDTTPQIGVHDVGISTEYEGAINGIKITRNNETIGANDTLTIGEEYTVITKIMNFGDFNESVNISFVITNMTGQAIDDGKNATRSIDAGDYIYFNVPWDTTGLMPGAYTITVGTNIQNDSNISNNQRSRNIMLEMPNQPPVANFTYEPANPTTADTIQFNDSSNDPDGYIVNYTWDFGDGSISYEQNPSHQYAEDGTYNVTLTVTDDDGATDSTYRHITISPVISLSIIYPVGGENIGGIIPVKWNATSHIGNKLTIKIEYKNETGNWKLIAEKVANEGIYHWNATGIEKGKQYKIKITASDNAGNNVSAESGFFTLSSLDSNVKTAYYNETKTITVTGTTGIVKLWYPTSMNAEWPTDYALKDQRDGSGGSARFSNVLFDTTGDWIIEDNESNSLFYILVNPIKLNVTAYPSEFDFTQTEEGWVTINGTVTHNGEPVKDVTVKIWAPGQTPGVGNAINEDVTNKDGEYKFVDIGIMNKGAGKYNITAYIGDFENPNAFGYTIFTVNSVEANISIKNNTAVGGFDIGKVIFEITGEGKRILDRYYNISIYKDGILYAWTNKTASGEVGNNKINFDVNGEILTLTPVEMWETGDYTLKVNVDFAGNPNWEYTGSIDYTISPPPPVTMKLISNETIDVKEPSSNIQTIQVQIFGGNMTTFADEQHGFTMDNITKRLKVEGDVIYSPPKDAYHYLGNGTWGIDVFPSQGKGKIYINVTWPDKGSDGVVVNVENGALITVEPTEVIADKPTDITITLKDKYGGPLNYATITLHYENGTYGLGEMVKDGTMTGDGSSGKGGDGIYKFVNISSKYAEKNIIVVASFQNYYAYGLIKSKAAHDLNATLSPTAILAGEHTKLSVNITKDGKPFDDPSGNFKFYILNETQLEKLHSGEISIESLSPVAHARESKGNFTFYITMDAGTYYLYIMTEDSKHDVPSGSEPSFAVTKANVVAAPSKLVKNVDKNMTVTFTVTWNGKPLNGTLRLIDIDKYTNYGGDMEINVKNGNANITGIDATAVGNITFEFKSEKAESEFASADGMLSVVAPEIAIVEPKEGFAYLGVENLIVVEVKHPVTGNGCKDLNVTVKMPGGEEIDIGKTDGNGRIQFGVIPLETGDIEMYVEGDLAGKIQVAIGLAIHAPTNIEKGKEMTIVVTTKAGNPVEGVNVKIDGTSIGKTDANGIIKYKPQEAKTITITAEKDGYRSATFTVEVKKGPEQQPGFEFIGFAVALIAAILIARRRK